MSVVIGGTIRGATIVSGGGHVVIDGKVYSGAPGSVTIIQGEPLPEVDETFSNVQSVEIDGYDVTLEEGDTFHVVGSGYCRRAGGNVTVSDFTGTITMPPVLSARIKVNSGAVRGSLATTALDLKSNSGDIRLSLNRNAALPSITAKANSGAIVINVV